MSDYLLEARDAARTFQIGAGIMQRKKTLRAVNGVSLGIQKGEVLGIVGESGCGKSTIARMLLGLLEPSDGAIYFDGNPLYDMDRLARARRIQPVFQDPYSSLNPRKTIEDIISLPLRVHNVGTRAERAEWLAEIMAKVGLSPRYLKNYPNQLSGGQRQRVAIARAFLRDAPIVLLDEPTSALDSESERAVQDALARLAKGRTTVIIAHRLSTIIGADKIIVMERGRLVEEGRHGELVARGGLYARLHALQFKDGSFKDGTASPDRPA